LCTIGVFECLLNFITRLHEPPIEPPIAVQITNEADGVSLQLIDGETQNTSKNTEDHDDIALNRRSWQAIDLLSKPSSTAFSDSIEKRLPELLERLFLDTFAPENTKCNYFHFMKLMENLLTNHRARIFEVLRRKNLVLSCLIPTLSRHPMIVHLLLYLIEMSQPLTSSNGNNFVIKRRFQAHLAQNELIPIILRHIYKTATLIDGEEQCEASCEFFNRFINELCVQEKGRQIQFERNRRNAREREKYLGKEYIEEEKRAKQSEKGTDDPDEEELDCVGDLLKSLTTSDSDFEQIFQVLLNWNQTTYTSRQCCARILVYLMDRTHPDNNVVVHYTAPTTKWMEDDEEEEAPEAPPNLVTMKVIHEHIMETMLTNLDTLCDIICADYRNYKKQKNGTFGVKLSAYHVRFGFTTLRMDLVTILLKTIRYMYQKFADDQSTPFATIALTENNVLVALIDWFFDYKFHNMYHNLFTELLSELITNGEREVLECILDTNDFLSRMIKAYLSEDITDNRAHIMHFGNLLRLMFDTLEPKSYLYRYLKSHSDWRTFVPILRYVLDTND
jgi:hypothetical protein